jgi:hypothetical protein
MYGRQKDVFTQIQLGPIEFNWLTNNATMVHIWDIVVAPFVQLFKCLKAEAVFLVVCDSSMNELGVT